MERNRRNLSLAVVYALILVACSSGLGRVITVDDDGPADFGTIQAAIDDANDGDVVIVQPGTYTGDGNRDIDIKGKAITVRSLDPNDWEIVAATVIDCEGTEEDHHQGFRFTWPTAGPDSVIAGLTITNGCANYGGAIGCEYLASPTITHCRLLGNRATRGGGLYVQYGEPIVRNCLILGNTASGLSTNGGQGGGIYYGGGPVTISDCTIAGNTASGRHAHPGSGGGIYLSNTTGSVQNCTIVGNVAERAGGVYCNQFGDIAISNSIIRANIAAESPQFSGTPSVSYCNVDGGCAGLGNFDADALFVDPNAGDYHLAAGSPCIDAGDPLYVPSSGQSDIDGEARVMGSRVDVGSDEFTAREAPVLDVWPGQLIFRADVNGTSPENQVVHIRNAGRGALLWSVTEDCPWLHVVTALGESAEAADGITVGVDTVGLASGRYDCEVVLTADGAPNSPVAVAVSLYIREGTILHVPWPYERIQWAVEASRNGDTVVVAEGVYSGPGNRDIDFQGKAITVRNTDPNDADIVAGTVIDCGGTDAEHHRAFLFQSGERSDSVVAGLTLTGGVTLEGGGVYIGGSSPTLRRCDIVGNACAASTWADRQRDKRGGGVYIGDGSPHIIDCVIAHNRCEDSFSRGGGVYCYGSPVFSRCSIHSNEAKNQGAGIYCASGGTLTLDRCTITCNKVTLSGGGVSLLGSSLMLSRCVVAGNLSGDGGAGLCLGNSTATIQNCTIAANSDTALRGGGVHFSLGRLSLVNTILWGNAAPKGSQISIYSWDGIMDDRGYNPRITGVVEISNCAIEGGQPAVYVHDDPACLQLTWGAGNMDADPLFADPSSGDFHLKSQAGRWDPVGARWVIDDVTSPCIDAGDPNSPVGDEPEPNGGRINMGVYGGTAEASKSHAVE